MSSVISGPGDFFFLSHLASRSGGFFQNFDSAQFLAFLNLRFSISISGVFSSLAGKKREWDRWIGKGLIR